MSEEESEIWRKYNEDKREKRWDNQKKSHAILVERGIKFKVLDETTAHYRIGEWNFWPTTGKFFNQKTGKKGRGVFNLLKILKNEKSNN